MAFNTMNNGYAEQQSSVNWGKVGLYAGGGIMAGGAARMGWRAIQGSKGTNWAKGQAKRGWAKAGGWKGIQSFGKQAFGGLNTAAGRGSQVSGGLGMIRGAGSNMVTRGMNTFATSGGKSGADTVSMGTSMMNTQRGGRARQAGLGAMGFFGGSGFSGMKRAGIMGARGGMLGAGIAAADFLNPFSLGWND